MTCPDWLQPHCIACGWFTFWAAADASQLEEASDDLIASDAQWTTSFSN